MIVACSKSLAFVNMYLDYETFQLYGVELNIGQ